jgi:hypothetical protein
MEEVKSAGFVLDPESALLAEKNALNQYLA